MPKLALAIQEQVNAQAARAQREHEKFHRQVLARMSAGPGEGGADARDKAVADKALAVLTRRGDNGPDHDTKRSRWLLARILHGPGWPDRAVAHRRQGV